MEEQMLQATIQLGSLPLHSSASAQGSTASTPSSRVLFLPVVTGKESNTWEVTLSKNKLLRKCQAWRCPSTVYQEKQGKEISNPTSLTSDPPAGNSVSACVCIHTVAVKGFWTFNCTLDLIQCTQHQAIALLELTLYRAGESAARFSPFSLRPSRAGGYSLQLAARLGEGELIAKPQLEAQARLVPSTVCKAAHGPARRAL